MSPPQQPAHLWLRPARGKRAAVWLIIDERRQVSTGCRASDNQGAERALEAYLAKKRIDVALPRAASADKVFVADVMRNYLSAKGDDVARLEELAARVDRLLDWWGDKTLAAVNQANCKAYVTFRSTPSAARRELEDLRAAINLAIREGVCRDAIRVHLPKKPKGRTRSLTRSETAKLLWTAWSYRENQNGVPTPRRPTQHVARVILTALYTTSR